MSDMAHVLLGTFIIGVSGFTAVVSIYARDTWLFATMVVVGLALMVVGVIVGVYR